MKTKVEQRGSELIMTREFNAPRKKVFEAHTDCKHLKKWFGPRAWPLDYCKMDFRAGGSWHFCMKGPNPGDVSWGKVIYKEIKAPERIVYEDYFSDKDGNINKSMPGAVVAIDFAENAGKTTLTSRVKYSSAEELQKVLDMGMIEGMNETLDRLEELLASKTTTV